MSAFTIKRGNEDELCGQEEYGVLVGPDGFECWLTEVEDREWFRDLTPVVELLESQHAELAELRAWKSEVVEAFLECDPRCLDPEDSSDVARLLRGYYADAQPAIDARDGEE